MELRRILLLPGYRWKFWNHLEACCLLPRSLPWRWQHLGDVRNFQVEGLYLPGSRSFQHEFQALCQRGFQRSSSFCWRTMVRNRTGIHSPWYLQQVHEMATRMAIQWLPWASGTILLLRRRKRLLRKNHFWHALQSVSRCWHQHFRNKRWGYARPVGILSWTMPWNRNGWPPLDGSLSS